MLLTLRRAPIITCFITPGFLLKPFVAAPYAVSETTYTQQGRRSFRNSSPGIFSSKSEGKRSTRKDAQPGRASTEYTLYAQVRLRPRQGSSIISIRRREDRSIADAEIAVGARPIDGQANEELVEFLREVCRFNIFKFLNIK